MARLGLAFCVILSIVQLGLAQVSASISGRVDDAAGGVVANATIMVESLETGTTRVATTDESGNFRVFSLAVGSYSLKAEKTGFQALVRMPISLAVGQEAVVNLRLQVGTIAQEVTISEQVPIVNTTTSSISGLVGEREVKDLPLNGRSFDNLITLNPGTINFGLKSAQTSTSNGNTFSVAGRRPSDNLVLIDGIEYTGSSQLGITPGGVSGYLLGIDAVREFNVFSDTYGSAYGKRAGAQVSVVTQSGSNAVHGSAFEFLRNSALDARRTFDQGSSPPPFQQNQFGASLGGPVQKDRFFLFGNYEGFRQRLATSNVSVVPDSQARTGSLPNTTTGAYSQVTGLSQGILPYTSFWPAPNGPELLVNGLPSGTALSYNNPKQSIREDFGTARSDFRLRDRDSLSTTYTVDDGNSTIPQADPLFGSVNRLRLQVASLQETHIFSPRMLNTVRAGLSRAAFNFDPYLYTPFSNSLSFVSGAGPGGIVIGGGTTTSGAAAITSAGPNNAAGVSNRRNLFTYGDDLQISRGKHQISLGAWFQRVQDNEDTASRRLGVATFASLTTFLQGTTSNFQVVPNPSELYWRSLFGAWYAEDAMRLTKNLTVRAGIRHEFTNGWNEAKGRAANYVMDSQGILVTAPRVSSSVYTQNNAVKLFGPRVGLAWDVLGNGKTSVRAGFGTYYSLIDDLAFLLNSLPPTNGSATFSGALSSVQLPIVPSVPVPPSCGPGVPTPCTTYAPQGIQADAKTPTVQEWNLSVEHELPGNTALRVAYVGSFGHHGLLNVDPNTVPAQVCSNASGCQTGGQGTARGSVLQGQQYIPVTTGRPNPYVGAGFFWLTEGNSSYNALQMEVNRRFGQGMQFRANYTWSKNLDMNSASTGAQANNQAQMVMDRNDLRRDWGPSALNVTSQASISARYELPIGQGKQWLSVTTGIPSKLISGWQINGISAFLTGFPFTPQIGANRSGDGNTRNPDRPSLNPAFTGPVLVKKQNQWFDPNAFLIPAVGTWGNLGRGSFTGPGLEDVDISLFKNTPISEKISTQFRAEFFNVLNHPNLGTPNPIVFAGTLPTSGPCVVGGGSTTPACSAISPSAGLITTTTTPPRQIQFGLKLIF
jgi:hypothetical protein